MVCANTPLHASMVGNQRKPHSIHPANAFVVLRGFKEIRTDRNFNTLLFRQGVLIDYSACSKQRHFSTGLHGTGNNSFKTKKRQPLSLSVVCYGIWVVACKVVLMQTDSLRRSRIGIHPSPPRSSSWHLARFGCSGSQSPSPFHLHCQSL